VNHHALIARKLDVAVENMRSACRDVAVHDSEQHADLVQWVFGISAVFEAWKLKHKDKIKSACGAPDKEPPRA